MTLEEYNAFCHSLTATHKVIQWGGCHVWKIAEKVFAIAVPGNNDNPAITFKTSEIDYEILRDKAGLRPAPYLASRGMKWIQHHIEPGLTDDDLHFYLQKSHSIVSAGLSKKKQLTLGLFPEQTHGTQQ